MRIDLASGNIQPANMDDVNIGLVSWPAQLIASGT
jgi:hypothetical protein